jgi:hypothetical protein
VYNRPIICGLLHFFIAIEAEPQRAPPPATFIVTFVRAAIDGRAKNRVFTFSPCQNVKELIYGRNPFLNPDMSRRVDGPVRPTAGTRDAS